MKYAILDTEGSGLFDYSQPADAEGQPRLASLAIITLKEDLSIDQEIALFVNPEGWEMNPGATKVNGLTTEWLKANGIELKMVLEVYTQVVEQDYILCAYNAQHDLKTMRGELRRSRMPDLFEKTRNICLMRACTNVCQIPRAKGMGYKFPKLSEACDHFGIEQEGAHTAMGDTKAALGVFLKLKAQGVLPEPAIYKAVEKSA